MDEHELLELGNKAVNQAQKLGADEAEIFLYMENQTIVEFVGGIFASRSGAVKGLKGAFVRIAGPWIKKKGLPKITSGIKAGVGVRAIVKKAIGFSSVSSIEEKRVLEAVEKATKTAKIRPPDPNWVSLPEGKKPSAEGGVFDKKFLELDIERLLESCADGCVIIGDFDKRIMQAMGSISAVSIAEGVVNTNGVEAFDKGTAFTAYFYAKAKSGAEEVSAGDFLMSRYYTEDLRPIAMSTCKRTIESLGKKPLPQKYDGPVVFENESWNELFSVIFTSGISALNIQENRSVYKGKIGKQVANESINIVDDGTLPEGFGTTKMDDEGVPKQKTPIIEKGLLTSILYDNYTAKREKRESTGSASRQGRATAAYANQPTIRSSNLALMPSKGSLQDLIGELKNGVLITGSLIGALHSNVITGDFSVTADNAFKIENGKVAFPLKPCTVAGNLYEALNHIIAIGNDSKSFGNIICPSLIVDKIVVST
ncbi:MAG TPA: TldD/PmbA family protein [Acidobacteriota bacterium]|nr:TldD/PmbA family protein [Acidobacteriota bacterium]